MSSNRFTWFVIGFFVFQALWVAISFAGMIYDEGFHFGIINIYTENWWPVIYNQPESYDRFRDFAGEGSKLFHYVMSYPQRLFNFFDFSREMAIFAHRVINIGLVAGGLYLFVRLFDRLDVKRQYINIALVITTSLPVLTIIAATVNYDNALFFLSPLFFIYLVKIIQNKEINLMDLVYLVTIGMIASLVKFTFLQIFAVGLVIVGTLWTRRYKKYLVKKIKKAFLAVKSKRFVLIPVSIILFLFFQTYVMNIFLYGTPRPNCQQTLGIERCLGNGVIKRNVRLLNTLNERSAVNFPDYTLRWSRGMVTNASQSSAVNKGKAYFANPLPLYSSMLFIGIIFGAMLTAYAWRELKLSTSMKLLTVVAGSYILTILAENLGLYYKYHANIAIHSRYTLIVIPIFILLIVLSAHYVLRKSQSLQAAVILLFAIALLQGGGLITHIVRSETDWYRDNDTIRSANNIAKTILKPMVKE